MGKRGAARAAASRGPNAGARDGTAGSGMLPVGQDVIQPRILHAFQRALFIADAETARHSARVGAAAAALGRSMGLPEGEVRQLRAAGILHDLGKLVVPQDILDKPGRLTAEEWIEIRRHPAVGADILLAVSADLASLADAVRSHHERWDGSGYPDGRVGDQIPLAGRILAVADVFDAVTCTRSYRSHTLGELEARALLVAEAGSHFDASVVKAYLAVRANAPTGQRWVRTGSRPSSWEPTLVEATR